jgi:hypothetical protein
LNVVAPSFSVPTFHIISVHSLPTILLAAVDDHNDVVVSARALSDFVVSICSIGSDDESSTNDGKCAWNSGGVCLERDLLRVPVLAHQAGNLPLSLPVLSRGSSGGRNRHPHPACEEGAVVNEPPTTPTPCSRRK